MQKRQFKGVLFISLQKPVRKLKLVKPALYYKK